MSDDGLRDIIVGVVWCGDCVCAWMVGSVSTDLVTKQYAVVVNWSVASVGSD